MAKNKPNYQSASGAYSASPQVQPDGGGFAAAGSIDCWRGSPQDLQRAVSQAIEALARENLTPTVRLIATDWAGVNEEYSSVDDWISGQGDSLEDFGTLRIEITAEDLTAAIAVRRKLPGITTEVRGGSQLRVDGFARVLHGALMRGYVDRYGGWWRPMAAMAVTLIPAGLLYGGIVATADEVSAVITALASVAALVACFFIMVNSWQWTLVRTPIDFVSDDAGAKQSIFGRAKDWRGHPRIAKVLALAGVVLISILANKLSDLIPWP
jgi:hypothetical protein